MLSSRPLRRLKNHPIGACIAVLILALASFVSFSVPNVAHAELGYLQYSGGVSVVPNQNIKGDDASGAGLSGRLESDAGYALGLALGVNAFEQDQLKVRGEVALDFRAVDISSLGLSLGSAPSKGRGDFNLFTAMINGFVDYDFGVYVVPYVGAGVGYGRFEVNAENMGAPVIGYTKVNDVASVFAWNVMAGLTIPFTKTVDFTIGYRYVATTDPKYNSAVVTPVTATGGGFVTRRLESQFDAHEEMIGLKIKF